MEERAGASQVVFRGRVLTVRVDPVHAKAGLTTREVVERGPAVAIVAETADHHLVVLRQFRWPVQAWLYELPAGMIDGGESPLAAAARELEEETGYRAQHWQPLYCYYASPGYSNELIYLFYATGLEPGPPHADPDEDLDVLCWSVEEVQAHLASGEVLNGILVIGLTWWLQHRARA
ncbi:MAG: NUDIX hydrolase [Firmicutes bacterium]|nr:NUDIX hydrolase [Bacillota bacterium]